jgi:hypothetical protein
MERKQILQILTQHCAGVASTKENGLVATKVYLDDLADELVNLFAINNVVGRSEQLVCGANKWGCPFYQRGKCMDKVDKCKHQVAK